MAKDPMDKVRRTLEKMKSDGITISYRPAPGVPGPGDRAMGILHAEAQKLGMTYGDEPDSASDGL